MYDSVFSRVEVKEAFHLEGRKSLYKYEVSIKSGTGGWYDYDNCDKCVAKLETYFLPRVGETIQIHTKDKKEKSYYAKYLVRDIDYWYIDKDKNGINVYVIPI